MMANGVRTSLYFALVLISGGCSAPNTDTSPDKVVNDQNKKMDNINDVSIEHCLKNGYEVAPIKRDNIPVSHLCVNKSDDRKCDSWAYYRGSCHL
jgi:putative hemolysin